VLVYFEFLGLFFGWPVEYVQPHYCTVFYDDIDVVPPSSNSSSIKPVAATCEFS
jgi:hypothetical protein